MQSPHPEAPFGYEGGEKGVEGRGRRQTFSVNFTYDTVATQKLWFVRSVTFYRRETSQNIFSSKHYFVRKIVLFGNVFTRMKTLFGSDNASQPKIRLGPLISPRLRDCVTARVTRVMRSPAIESRISIWHLPRLRSHANIIWLEKLPNTLIRFYG